MRSEPEHDRAARATEIEFGIPERYPQDVEIFTSWGTYGLQHLLPGTFTLRASKAGYDSIDRTVTASKSTLVDFELKPSYGAVWSLSLLFSSNAFHRPG